MARVSEPPFGSQGTTRAGKLAELTHMSSDLHREADCLFLAQYVPPLVVVNDRLEIIQTRGHTRPSWTCRQESQPRLAENGTAWTVL